MPEKSFIITLTENVFIYIYFMIIRGNIGRFVVKLNLLKEGNYFEIARYDSGSHEPHLDIFHPDGYKERVVDYGILENDQAMNVAIKDFKNNWKFYIERWEKWLQQEKK